MYVYFMKHEEGTNLHINYLLTDIFFLLFICLLFLFLVNKLYINYVILYVLI